VQSSRAGMLLPSATCFPMRRASSASTIRARPPAAGTAAHRPRRAPWGWRRSLWRV
jgi:hypothetical protein